VRRGSVIGQGELVYEVSGHTSCGNLRVIARWDRGSRP